MKQGMKRCMFYLMILCVLPYAAWALPSWITELPNSEVYTYYRGEGMDTDPERAKVKARSDAFKKIQMATAPGQTGPLAEGLNLTESSASLRSESSVAFDPARIDGLETVADHDEIIPIGGQAAHRYFILMRIPKPKPGLIARGAKGITGRVDAVFHSAIFPGWGQIRQGREGEGAFFAFAAIMTGISAGTFYALEKENVKSRAEDWKGYRRGSVYAFGGIYAASLVSALVGGHRPRDGFSFEGTAVRFRF